MSQVFSFFSLSWFLLTQCSFPPRPFSYGQTEEHQKVSREFRTWNSIISTFLPFSYFFPFFSISTFYRRTYRSTHLTRLWSTKPFCSLIENKVPSILYQCSMDHNRIVSELLRNKLKISFLFRSWSVAEGQLHWEYKKPPKSEEKMLRIESLESMKFRWN